MNREAGKGSRQRPGQGYGEGWEQIWGNKRSATTGRTAQMPDNSVQPVTAGETAQNNGRRRGKQTRTR